MSGICAIYRTGGAPVSEEEINTLLLAGAHRGCDGAERRIEGSTGLGHLAQRSVDHRTIGIATSSDFTLSLTADARLDRDTDLERELKARGMLPASGPATDSEIILAAYQTWGEEAIERIGGDFAILLWDSVRRTLLVARDRLGIKPLTYTERDGNWFFASEAQQLVSHPEIPYEIDRRTIVRYLAHCLPTDDRTPFDGVQTVPPGSFMVVSHRGGARRSEYWFPGATTYENPSGEELMHVLRDAIDRRLRRPSGPVGLLMSGGLDSCSVAAIAHETLGPELRPITHAFETLEECDERRFTDAMRDRFGFHVDYNWPEKQSLFPVSGDHPDREDPFLGWSTIHARAFETLKKAGARVVLTGHGGDSVFGGSPLVYADALRRNQYLGLFDSLRRHARERQVPLTSLIYHYLLAPRFPALSSPRFRATFGKKPLAKVPSWILPEVAEEKGVAADLDRFYQPHHWGQTARDAMRSGVRAVGSVGRAVGLLDRFGHRFGLDIRHPYLDADLIDYVLSLPPETFYSGGESKLPLRRRLTQLPPEVRTRRSKTAFHAYFNHRLRGHDRGRLLELLDPAAALSGLGFVDTKALSSVVHRYIEGSDEVPASVIFFTANVEGWLRARPPGGRV